MELKKRTKMVITFTGVFAITVLTSVCCMKSGISPLEKHTEKLEWDFPIEVKEKKLKPKVDNVIEHAVTEPRLIKRRFLRIVYKLEYSHSVIRYTTCYTDFDKGDPGHGIYANQKYADKLHLYERRIRYEHNTVALCPEDKVYHEELIEMPDGKWTNRYRVHIQGVHSDQIGDSTDTGYFGVPRDRMKQSKRIDYLITTAGKFASIQQRIRNWKSIDRKVDFWKWNVYRLYDDGLLEPVND